MSSPAGVEQKIESDAATRSPWLPCLVAWLFPGAGHIVLGQFVSGAVFAGVVLTTLMGGLMMNGTVYARDPEQPLSNLAIAANLGLGPLDLVARQATFGRLIYAMPDSRVDPVRRNRILKRLRRHFALPTHAYGRTFILTAGLMNLLLILDVYDHCIGRKGRAAARAPDEGSRATEGEES